MKKRRRGKRKTRKKAQATSEATADRRGGTEFDEHVKLARKLVNKLRRKVAALRPKKRRKN